MQAIRVLAAVDGSPGSVVAAGYGALIASASGGSLGLAYVTEDTTPARGGSELAAELAERERRTATEALDLAQTAVIPFGGPISRRVLNGNPAAAILAEAHDGGYDLIAMGGHGINRSALGRLFAGSTALQVLDDTTVPVLLVPDAAASGAGRPTVDSLLVPTDGSRASRDAAEFAALIAEATSASVLLLHCEEELLPEGFAALAFSPEEREELARGQQPLGRLILHATQEPFLRRGIAVDLLDVRGNPAERILETARGEHSSLIVMGSYGAGESILHRERLGSVTEAVAGNAPCPVIVCKRTLAGNSPA